MALVRVLGCMLVATSFPGSGARLQVTKAPVPPGIERRLGFDQKHRPEGSARVTEGGRRLCEVADPEMIA
jgi:hypothetical protein